jgi:lysyl-tRNA synthetase class 2
MGKLSFATLRDATGDIQIAFVKNHCTLHTGKELLNSIEIAGKQTNSYKFAEKYLDIGDFVGVKGELFVTKHGELTLFIDEYQLLSKALRPLGDKRHGVKDEETIYRQRYLDMTMNEESYATMLIRSKFLKTLREFYWSHDFIELDTPILGNSASGAAATPFRTHHEDFGIDMYLRIAPEIALKMATA